MSLPILKETNAPLVIGIASGKGGVGKSTVTVHLAAAFHKKGLRVGILDADLYGPSIRKMLPEDRMPKQEGERWIPAWSGGIRTMSIAYFRSEGEAAIVRAPIANRLIHQFLHQVDWGELDILLIDFPPGTGDIQISLSQEAPMAGSVLVTTPQEVATLDVRKAMNLFDQVNVPILGVIENMSYFKDPVSGQKIPVFGRDGGKKLAQESGVELLAEIPVETQISQCCDQGQTLFQRSDWNEYLAANLFLNLSEKILSAAKHAKQAGSHFSIPFALKLDELEVKTDLKTDLIQDGSVDPHPTPSKIQQLDRYTVAIEWKDGALIHYRLSDLQHLCPCAACTDEETGLPKHSESSRPKDVTAHRIESVGRYAFKIQYARGCSHGIYSYQFLRTFFQRIGVQT